MNRFMMRRAQELGTKLAKVQEELEKVTVEASSGGGAVTVVVMVCFPYVERSRRVDRDA